MLLDANIIKVMIIDYAGMINWQINMAFARELQVEHHYCRRHIRAGVVIPPQRYFHVYGFLQIFAGFASKFLLGIK